MSGLPALTAGMTFDQAVRAVLGYLREHVPMGLWTVTRVENGRQTFLYLDEDNAYAAPQGASSDWEGSICVRMVAGEGPRVAHDVEAVPAYRGAPVRQLQDIGAYAAAPINDTDGSVFGTLCGLDPRPRGEELLAVEPLLTLLTSLLDLVLAADRARDAAVREASVALTDAETDVLTGLLNRRGWEARVAAERERFERLGDPTVVVVLDLDRLKDVNDRDGHAAGDAHLIAAARALSSAVRTYDPTARLGGDEFAVLMAGCTEDRAAERVELITAALHEAGVAGSIGWAPLSVLSGFPAALAAADAAMYAAKRAGRHTVCS